MEYCRYDHQTVMRRQQVRRISETIASNTAELANRFEKKSFNDLGRIHDVICVYMSHGPSLISV